MTIVVQQTQMIIERIFQVTQLPKVSVENTRYVLEVLTPEVNLHYYCIKCN